MLTGNWAYPNNIKLGAGRIVELGEACKQAGISRPLLVTDRNLANLPVTEVVLNIMHKAGFKQSVFSNVDPNPTEKNLDDGIKAFRVGNHDGVIALGGGSGLDLGKMIAFMAGQTRPVWDFEDIGDWWTRADAAVISPIIAIPTTAGTGSEVGRASVISNSVTKVKKIIFHPKVLPEIAICDPELTLSMPKHITAGTGLDAFAHCVEAFSSPHYHPMSQGIALEGMRLIIKNLPKAYADGNDIEARSHMMVAAMMGATAFQKGLGAIHAVSHPIGAKFHTHHGTTNAIFMPAVLQLNKPKIKSKLDNAVEYLGIQGGFDGFCDFVWQFNEMLGIPKKLSGLGVENPDIETLIEEALHDPSCAGNPVELNKENVRELFLQVL